MKQIACIYNEGSGSIPDKSLLEKVFGDLAIAIDFIDIKLGESATANKLKEKSYWAVVAAGGDGTVRLAAQLAIKTKQTLGILPLGTLNHFAKDLELPLDLEEAARLIASGATRLTDYCTVNDQVFVNNASLGIYPATVIDRDKVSKFWGKWLAGAKALLRAVRSNKNLLCTVITPEGESTYLSPLIFIGNNKYQVDKVGLGGRDNLNAGKLFLYVVRTTHRRRLILLGLLSVFGVRLRSVDSIKQTKGPITIESAKPSTAIALDGEVLTMDFPLQFEMHPSQLTVLS